MRGGRFRQIALLLALVVFAAPTSAENARPGFKNLPFEEDWSVLRGRASDDPFDSIKYIPFDENGDYWLSLGGQLRGRFELWRHLDYGRSMPAADDEYLLSRFRLHADLHPSQYLRLFAEFKSSLSTDRQLKGGKRSVDVDTAALQNGFAEFMLPVQGVDLGLYGGRRELQFGAQRLVSPLDWANSRRTFDGGGAYARGEGWQVTSFWSRPVIVEKYEFNKATEAQQFYGVYSTFDLPCDGLGLDLYWLGISFDTARAANDATGAGSRHTIGSHLFGDIPHTPLEIDLEGAVQVGSVGSSDILAGMVSAMLTWPLDSLPLTPAVFLGYDWASGDSADDGKVGTFDQLFPLAHAWLGLIDAIARQNMHGIQGGVRITPFAKGVVAMNWLSFWLDDLNDFLYSAPGKAILPKNTNASSRHVGTEVDLTLEYEFIRGLATRPGGLATRPGGLATRPGDEISS